MKVARLFVIISLLFIIPVGVYAQNRQMGVIGGINIANVNMDKGDIDIQNLTGMGIGGVLDFGFSESISWRFEPMYLLKGAKATAFDDTSAIEQKLKFKYVEIPLFLKISFGTSDIQPYIMAGASIGILLDANVEINEMSNHTQIDLKDKMNGIEYGIGFGGGINFFMGKLVLFAEGRYTTGIVNLFKNSGIMIIPGEQSQIKITYVQPKNMGFQIFTGVCIPLGG